MVLRLSRCPSFLKDRFCPLLGLLVLLTLFVILGSLTTLISKFQNEFFVKEDQFPPRTFSHPLFQTLCVMVGYCGVGVVALASLFRNQRCRRRCRRCCCLSGREKREKLKLDLSTANSSVGGDDDVEGEDDDMPISINTFLSDIVDVELVDSPVTTPGTFEFGDMSPATAELGIVIGENSDAEEKEEDHQDQEKAQNELIAFMELPEEGGEQQEANDDDVDDKEEDGKEKEEEKVAPLLPDLNLLLYLPPAVFNISGNIIIYIGLLYTYAAIYEMMLSLIVIYSAILSLLVFRKCPTIAEWLGIGFIVIGAALVGASSVLFGSTGSATSQGEKREYSVVELAIGNVCCVVGMLGFALEYIFQELIMKQKWASSGRESRGGRRVEEEQEEEKEEEEQWWITSPTTVVWIEGLWGLPVALFACFIGTLINWDNVPNALLAMTMTAGKNTSSDVSNNGGGLLSFLTVALIACLGSMNWIGVILTDRVSATYRAVLGCLRMVVVWVVQVIRGRDSFHWMRLLGMVGIAAGNVVYTMDLKKVFRWCKMKCQAQFCRNRRVSDEEEGEEEGPFENEL